MQHYPEHSKPFDFIIRHQSKKSDARLGLLKTPHGNIETPAFIFCATKAAIKGVTPIDMKAAGTQIILSNTYHLMLQPGPDVIRSMGGLHRFMGWDGPLLTDSGGFQIFSLGHGGVSNEIKSRKNKSLNNASNRLNGSNISNGTNGSNGSKMLQKITEEGALFRSYLDGSLHLLTPERSIQIQRALGADIILVLDECTPFHVDKDYTARSMNMSHRWAERSVNEFLKHDNGQQSLYGIVQGGIYRDLRKQSADFINALTVFGQAIGGSLGADKQQMTEIVSFTKPLLNPKRPTHLLGIGGISDIFEGVKAGIDTFDCVHPTRLARHGGALVKKEHLPENKKTDHINLKNSIFRLDDTPLEPDCTCHTCLHYSRAYLHHLLKAKEILVFQLLTIHNVAFMNRLMSAIRRSILEDTLAEEEKNWVKKPCQNTLHAEVSS